MRRLDRESTRLGECALLIEKEFAIQRIQNKGHEARGAEQASSNVHHVAASGRLRCNRDLELRIEHMLDDNGRAQFFRIFADQRLELGNRIARSVKRAADMNLASVNLQVESERMAELIDTARL